VSSSVCCYLKHIVPGQAESSRDRVARTPAVFAPLLSLTFNRELNRLSEALIKESQACFRLRSQNSFTELHEQCNCATEVMASSEQMNNEPGRTLSGLL
jgi:hypothetical protein